MTWLYTGLALLSGAALAMQMGVNNGLRERIGHPLSAASFSFATGTMALLAFILAIRPSLPRSSSFTGAPWWIWLGGVVGACYILVTITFSNRLGAAAWLGVVVTGQILTSVILDHYGLVGFQNHPVTPWRVVGVVLLLAGAAIVLRT